MMQHTTQEHLTVPIRTSIILLVVALAAGLALFASTSSAYAVTAAEKQAEAEEALANLTAMQESLDKLSAEHGEAVAARNKAAKKRDAAKVRIGEIQEELESVQARLGERAREMYRSGGVTFIEMVLGASTFEEFATSLDMVNRVNQNDADMVDTQRKLKAEAKERAKELEEQAKVADQKAKEAAEAEEQAQETVQEMQAIYDSLSAEAAELLEEERKAREAEEAARAAAVLAAAQAAAEAEAAERAAQEAAEQEAAEQDDQADDGSDEVYEEEDETPDYTDDTDQTGSDDGGNDAVYEGGSDTVSRAYACLGAPYVWGAVGPNGYDCSGLVSYCLTGVHARLGTTYTFMEWPTVSNPQPGDIAVNWGHTGVYIGDGQMIHAATYGVGVIIGPVQSGMKFVRYGG